MHERRKSNHHSPKHGQTDEQHMRVQAGVLISQIRIRNVVVLVSQINCSAAAGCEQLHTATKLSSKVELLSGSKHSMVEIEEAAATRQKWFDPAKVHEIYLCADRAATDAVGIRSSASTGVPVADQRQGDGIENPAHCDVWARVDKPFVAALELIISRTHRTRKRMPVFKRSPEPIRVFAVRVLLLLCDC